MADIQVVSPIGLRSFGPDLSPVAEGLGTFVSERINERLQKKALEGDQGALTKLSSRDPRAAAQVGDIFNQEQQQQAAQAQQAQKMQEQERAIVPNIAQGYFNAKDKKGYLSKTAGILREQGFERLAVGVEEDVQQFDADPEGVNMEYEASLAMFTDPEKGQQLSVALQDRENLIQNLTGAKNPATGKAFTRLEAAQEVALRQAGIVPRAVGSAGITTAQTPGLTQQVAQSESIIEDKTTRAEAGARTAGKVVDEGFERIGKVQGNIRNIDRAISALDRGAGTGAIEKFLPSVTAASRELDQIRNELGLDVVGATTFGALSKGELDLALDTALPTGLDEPQLKDFLQRKRESQTKVINYLDEQIQFLEGGGTVGGFRAMKKAQMNQGSQQTQQAAQPEQAQQPAIEDLSDEDYEKFRALM